MLSRLYTPLLVVIVAISSWAAFGPLSIFICLLVFGLALALAVRGWPGFWIVVICIFLLAGLFMPAIESAREVARRMTCTNNMKCLALAVHNYEASYHCLPPACIADKNGKPMHSWRVLILPFLERKDLYDQYDFNEPWDGLSNRKLLASRPSVYACPCDEVATTKGATVTNYVAVVGQDAIWHNDKPRSFQDPELFQKMATTIMLSETSDVTIGWTEPRDISLNAIQSAASQPETVLPLSQHGRHAEGWLLDYDFDSPNVVNIAMADASVHSFPFDNFTIKRLPDLLKIGGCTDEPVANARAHREATCEVTVHWHVVAGLAVWLFSIVLLFHQSYRIGKKRQRGGNSHS